ncbi:MAG: FliH/SctL family protein [Solirubrobacteraceae bacterium]
MATQNVSTYKFSQLDARPVVAATPAEALNLAQEEAQGILQQARTEGLTAGHAEGVALARAEAQSALVAAAEAQDQILKTREELVEKLSRQAGELALQIAERIVAGAIAAEPQRLADVARAALRQLSERHHVTVLVNPDDLELMQSAAQPLQTELGGIEHLDVQADRRVQRGGVVARTAYGEIDASVATQLDSAREIVFAALNGDVKTRPADGDEFSASHPPDHDL